MNLFLNSKQIRVFLGICRKTYLPGSVPSVFEFKPAEKKKERKPSKPRNNQETSSEFETESESSDPQYLGDASNSVVDFPHDIDDTNKLLAENESLRCKIEHLELENKKLKEENIKLKSHIYNFDNVSESGDEFRAATGLTVESFNNLQEFLNPGKSSCNITFYGTSSRLSQSCDDIGSPKSFLGGRSQLTKAEVKELQTIASVRIHVERAISHIKKFQIIRNKIRLTFHGSINQIWTVCYLLCNFMPPLIRNRCMYRCVSMTIANSKMGFM